jgi:hypothetical protein
MYVYVFCVGGCRYISRKPLSREIRNSLPHHLKTVQFQSISSSLGESGKGKEREESAAAGMERTTGFWARTNNCLFHSPAKNNKSKKKGRRKGVRTLEDTIITHNVGHRHKP